MFIMTSQGQHNDLPNTQKIWNITLISIHFADSWQTFHAECLKSNKDCKATLHRPPVLSFISYSQKHVHGTLINLYPINQVTEHSHYQVIVPRELPCTEHLYTVNAWGLAHLQCLR